MITPTQAFTARIDALVATGMLESEARRTVFARAIRAWEHRMA